MCNGTCGTSGNAGASCQCDNDCAGSLACINGVCGDDSGGGGCNSDSDCDGGVCVNGSCCDPYSDPCCGNNGNGNGNGGGGDGGSGGDNCGGMNEYCGLGSENMNGTTGCCSPLICDDGGTDECVLY